MAHDHRTVTPAPRETNLWIRCRNFVEEQAAGEWNDKTIADDADKLMEFVMRETQPMRAALTQFVAACETAPPTSLMIEIGMACKVARSALCSAASARMEEPPREVSIVPNSQAKTEVEG
jgi:hypothetical protein